MYCWRPGEWPAVSTRRDALSESRVTRPECESRPDVGGFRNRTFALIMLIFSIHSNSIHSNGQEKIISMSKAIDNLQAAQQRAMAIRPKVGGFPYLAEALRQAGVTRNLWYLPACQSL